MMRNITLILLGFCCSFQAQSQSTDTLDVMMWASVKVTACTAWVEDSTGIMSNLITLPPVRVGDLKNGQTAVGKTTFKVKFQCSKGDIVDIYYNAGNRPLDRNYESLSVRLTAKSEIDPATQSLKNSVPENSNGAKDIGFLIRDRQDNTVQFETGSSDATPIKSFVTTDGFCENIDPVYQPRDATFTKEYDLQCGTYTFPFSVEYIANGDNPGPGVVGADATVTVQWY